jgi:hypothetical protein
MHTLWLVRSDSREARQRARGRGAFRAEGREEGACRDVAERCGVAHAAGGDQNSKEG